MYLERAPVYHEWVSDWSDKYNTTEYKALKYSTWIFITYSVTTFFLLHKKKPKKTKKSITTLFQSFRRFRLKIQTNFDFSLSVRTHGTKGTSEALPQVLHSESPNQRQQWLFARHTVKRNNSKQFGHYLITGVTKNFHLLLQVSWIIFREPQEAD